MDRASPREISLKGFQSTRTQDNSYPIPTRTQVNSYPIPSRTQSGYMLIKPDEYECGDSEDGEDDELSCVIRESAGDCVWQGSRRSVGTSFHRQGAAYLKERLVIFKEERVGGRARVTVHRWRTCIVRRLNRNRVVEILKLVGCKYRALWVRLGIGYELTWVRVGIGYEMSWVRVGIWVRVDLGTSWPAPDLRSALSGQWNYVLVPAMSHHQVPYAVWSTATDERKNVLFDRFLQDNLARVMLCHLRTELWHFLPHPRWRGSRGGKADHGLPKVPKPVRLGSLGSKYFSPLRLYVLLFLTCNLPERSLNFTCF